MVCETEKPNLEGCLLKRDFRIVDLPVPEGPEMTTGGKMGWEEGVEVEVEDDMAVMMMERGRRDGRSIRCRARQVLEGT